MAKKMGDMPQGGEGIKVLEQSPERIDQPLFLQLLGRMQAAKATLNTSKSKYDNIRKEMKKDGVNLKVLDFVRKLMDMNDEDVVIMFNQIQDYMKFMGIDGALRQQDLFANAQEAGEKEMEVAAYEAGFRAAHLDLDDTNPHKKGENLHECWLNGLAKGKESVKAGELKANKSKPKLVKE